MTSPGPAPGPEPIEMTVVGGYLGAGKTTLVNSVLRRADQRVAVLVNDFGEVNIDADLLAADDERSGADGIVRLANGCICCTMADGLASALATLAEVEPRPERLLIEASGVSDPQAIAAYGHTPGFGVNAVVVVVDAETFLARLRDPYVGDTVERQLHAADLVVVNKVSLAGPAAVERVRAWLSEHQPSAVVVETDHSEVPLDVLFGPSLAEASEPGGRPDDAHGHAHDHDHDHDQDHGSDGEPHARFETWTLRVDQPIAPDGLDNLMKAVPDEVMRVKGFVYLEDAGVQLLQRVGRRWTLEPTGAAPAGGRTVLILIGRPGAVDPDHLCSILTRHQ